MAQAADRPSSGLAIAAAIAAAQVALHLVTAGNYGIFRDELYYLDCARHLGWGYVDHPPLSIWLLAAVTAVLGESVHAIRLLSTLAGAALIVVTALIAREMGGGRLAQGTAALAVAVAPGPLVITGFFSMNAFDLLFWAVLAWMLVRIARSDDPALWLPFGAVAGLGLLNKTSVLFLGFGVAAAILATPLRRHLARWQPWAGGAVALLLFSPYLAWNAAHGWPTLEFMSNARRFKIAAMSPLEFFGEQVLAMNPPLAPLWLGGLVWLLAARDARRIRAAAWTFLAVFALLVSLKVKPYYLFAAFALLLPAGSCAVGSLVGRLASSRGRRWAAAAAWIWIASAGLLTLPLAAPLLPPDDFLAYQEKLGLAPKPAENNPVGAMPQHFADRFGWEEMTRVVAEVYRALPEDEREAALIVGGNYGEAGAINYYGPALGLPRAVSTHNSHYLWGFGLAEPRVIVHIGGSREELLAVFEEVEQAAVVKTRYSMPYESDLPVFLLRRPRVPLEEAWRAGKKFI